MNTEAFEHIINGRKNKLFRYALRILLNPAEAEDVVQEVFIKLWDHREQMDNIQNIDHWCLTVTRNLSIDKLRNKHNKTATLDFGTEISSAYANPYKQTLLNDAITQLHELMSKLPQQQRDAVHFRDIEGLSYQEIAENLAATPEQVKTWIFRGRQKLKTAFQKANDHGL